VGLPQTEGLSAKEGLPLGGFSVGGVCQKQACRRRFAPPGLSPEIARRATRPRRGITRAWRPFAASTPVVVATLQRLPADPLMTIPLNLSPPVAIPANPFGATEPRRFYRRGERARSDHRPLLPQACGAQYVGS